MLTPEERRERRREAARRSYAKHREKRLAQRAAKAAEKGAEAVREATRQRVADWRRDNPKKRLLANARSRCAKSGVEFALTEEDFEIPDVCPALGIPLVAVCGKPTDGSPSLDRIDPTIGYVPGNIQVISYLANSIKYTATAEQILAVGQFMLRKAAQVGPKFVM